MFLKINIGFIVISGLIFCINAHGQTIVGMGTDNPNPNAVLELVSKHQNQGFLMPRLTTSQRNASGFTSLLSSKDNGLLVFDTDEGFFYYWYKDKWQAVGQGEYDGPTTIPVWLAGEAMPKDSEGKDGDFYLHQSTGNVYRKQENTFILIGNLQNQGLQYAAGTGIQITDQNEIVNTGDIDPVNELQHLNLSGSTLSLSGSPSTVDLSILQDGTGTDNQTLSLAGNSLSISGGNNVDISSINTDSQNLSHSTTGQNVTLNISGGTGTTFSVADNDSDAFNELQDLNLSSNNLTITNNASATVIDLSPYLDNTDNQNLSLTGDSLSISDGNSIDISSINTDSQDLSHTRTGEDVTLNISGGTATTFSVADNDSDATNEVQDLSLSSHALTITNNASATTVDLSTYLDNTDSQNLSHTKTGEDVTLNISGGTATTFSVADNDSDATNEVQDLSLSSHALTITNNASATTVDLSPYVDNTDSQSLNLTGDSLSISGGNSVDLSSYLDNTDSQTLSLVGNNLSIAGGNSVDISSINSDNQTLSLAGNSLSIAGGNNVDLSSYLDNTDSQSLSLTGNNLSISGGNSVDISSINSDNQTLSLAGNSLSIAGGNNVDLSSYLDNTDSQNLSHTRTGEDITLNISGGTATTFSVADNDSSVSNETITNAALNVNTLEITEAGTTHTVDLSSIKGSTYTGGEGISVIGTTVVAKADSVTIGFDASQNLKVLDNGITDAQIANVAPSKLLAEGAADGDVLTYNSGSGKWESIAPSASTVTQYYSVDPTDFVSVNGASNMKYNGVNGGSASTVGGSDYMIAPIHLPQGAVIEEVKFYVYDNLLGLSDITCSLQSKALNSEATTDHATESTGLLTLGDATLTATGLSITIDNSTKSYRIKVEAPHDILHKVYGARITYTETL